jgi:hypothetical protein
MLFLRQIGWQVESVTAGGSDRAACRQTNNTPRRSHVAVQQRRGKIADSNVVKAVARFVGRQQRCDIHVYLEEVAYRVLILSAVQSAEGTCAPGIGRGGVEILFYRIQQVRIGRLIGPG